MDVTVLNTLYQIILLAEDIMSIPEVLCLISCIPFKIFLQFRFTVSHELFRIFHSLHRDLIASIDIENIERGFFHIFIKIRGPWTATNVVQGHMKQLLGSLIPSEIYTIYIVYHFNGRPDSTLDIPYYEILNHLVVRKDSRIRGSLISTFM